MKQNFVVSGRRLDTIWTSVRKLGKTLIMKKKPIFLCVALMATNAMCLTQTSPSARAEPVANATTITALEESAWQAYKNKQTRSLETLLYKSYHGVYSDGIKTLGTEVADMAKTDLQNYSLVDIKVEFPNANVAVITYKATQQATSDGKDVSGAYYNESVWVKKGEKWLNTLHTKIKSK
jgi:uncharacterized protein DUF4440